jgi:hypothetical protein
VVDKKRRRRPPCISSEADGLHYIEIPCRTLQVLDYPAPYFSGSGRLGRDPSPIQYIWVPLIGFLG